MTFQQNLNDNVLHAIIGAYIQRELNKKNLTYHTIPAMSKIRLQKMETFCDQTSDQASGWTYQVGLYG